MPTDVEVIKSLTLQKLLHELLTNEIIHKVFAIVFIIATFLQVFLLFNIYLENDWYGHFYIDNLKGFEIERFSLPLLYWLGLLVYLPFGEPGLFGISIVMFSIAFIYLSRLFWNYKFMLPLIFPIIFLRHESANWLLFFSRDALVFMFASMFAYYFYRTWIKKDRKYWKMALICILALYTKSSGILLIILLLVLYLYQNVKNLTYKNGFLAVTAIPLFRDSWIYSAWLADFMRGVESFLYRFKVNDIVFLFPNALFFFSFFVFIATRGFIPFIIIFLSLGSGVVINNISTQFYDAEVIWRYTFIMVPLNLMLIAKAIQDSWDRYKSNNLIVYK